MSTIRETVTEALRRQGYTQYLQYAEPTITALEAREHEAVEHLVEAGVNLGADRGAVIEVVREAGLQARPVVAAVSNGNADLYAQIDALRDSINQMNQALDSIARSTRR